MGLRGWIKRLERDAQKDMVILRLKDGGISIFSDLEVFKEMFLCRTDLFRGEARPSEVFDAVRAATPESRAAFEEEYGSIEMVNHVIAADYQRGWVDEYRLLEDGAVEMIHHEGGSEAAERIRREARQGGPEMSGL
jgi:hypothetical protein